MDILDIFTWTTSASYGAIFLSVIIQGFEVAFPGASLHSIAFREKLIGLYYGSMSNQLMLLQLISSVILAWKGWNFVEERKHKCKILGSESFTRCLLWGTSTRDGASSSSGGRENRKVFASLLPANT